MRESVESSERLVTFSSMPPLWLIVPANNGLPAALDTGIDSPVRDDSSTLVAALQQHSVHRDLLAGPDDDDLADFDFLDRDLHAAAAPFDQRLAGPQREQRLDRPLGAVHRMALQDVGEAEKEQQQRALEWLADQRRAERGKHHQYIHIQHLLAQRGDGRAHALLAGEE